MNLIEINKSRLHVCNLPYLLTNSSNVALTFITNINSFYHGCLLQSESGKA